MIKVGDVKKEPKSPAEAESSGWRSSEDEEEQRGEGVPREQLRWIEAGGWKINRNPNEEWEEKERWIIEDMENIVDGTPTLLLYREVAKAEKPRRAMHATTVRKAEEGEAPPAREPAARGNSKQGAAQAEIIRRAVSGETPGKEVIKPGEESEIQDVPGNWAEGTEAQETGIKGAD